MKRAADEVVALPAIVLRDTRSEYEHDFAETAERLLNSVALRVKDSHFRLLEVEFYVRTQQTSCFVDPYAHADPVQLSAGTFYFHRTNGKSYKGGTYKGMDLAFGRQQPDCYAGILVRTIQNVATKEVVCGPCLCVNKILEILAFDSIQTLVDSIGIRSDVSDAPFALVPFEHQKRFNVLQSPRVGLSLKAKKYGPDEVFFFGANLRYVICPELINKHKHLLALALIAAGKDDDTIARLAAVKHANIKTWRDVFQKGKRNP